MSKRNNEVGANRAYTAKDIRCKCHGPSGSCSAKTCWYELPEMEKVGSELKSLYYQAQQVKWRQRRDCTSQPLQCGIELFAKYPQRGTRDNNKKEIKPLIFMTKSPNFCEPNEKKGILGTSGRECNANSDGPDGCKELCCKRGFYSTNKTVRE